MKKCILALAVIVMAGGIAWGQMVIDAAENIESIESRFSQGRFTSDVDDYKDPGCYNPNIGTFFFMGGYGEMGVNPAGTVSAGFAKTINEKAYLALFYAAKAVDASGTTTDPGTTLGKPEGYNPSDFKKETDLDVTWNNRLALMFGTAGMGFRFDMILDNVSENNHTYDGKVDHRDVNSTKAAIGLTWGALIKDSFSPYVSLGLTFPNVELRSNEDPDDFHSATKESGGRFDILAGVWADLKNDQSIYAELQFGAGFADSYKGDEDGLPLVDASPDADGNFKDYTEGGGVDLNLYAHYQKALTFGEATVKFKPKVGLGIISQSHANSLSDVKLPSDDTFTVSLGLDIGAEYKHDKIGLYTGLGLQFFEYTVDYASGGDDDHKYKDTDWRFTGLKWTDDTALKFGLTFTPINGLVFGVGVSTAFDILPEINLKTMEITPKAVSFIEGMKDIFKKSAIAVTASYKY